MSQLIYCVVIAFGAAPPADTKPVQELIRGLGAEEFQAREEVTRRLMRRHDAAPALEAALSASDLEVRSRADRILTALRAQRRDESTKQARRLLSAGRIDLAVLLLTECGGSDWRSGPWLDVKKVVTQLHDSQPQQSGRLLLLDDRIDQWLAGLEPPRAGGIQHSSRELRIDELLTGHVFSRGFRGATVFQSVLVTTDSLQLNEMCVKSLVLTTTGSAQFKSAGMSVLICAGDVTFRDKPVGCIIIARGSVTVRRSARYCIIHENVRGPVGGIRFFELDEFGLIIAQGTDVARAVHPGVFRDAGLRPGDTFVSVGGEKALHAEQIRTLFMRHFLRPGPVYLKVKRGGEPLALSVNIPESLQAKP